MTGTSVYRARAGCTGPGWVPGWVYRWVPGGAIPGTTQPARFARKEVLRQRSGPRRACRARSGWSEGRVRPSCRNPPLRGPVGPMLGPPWFLHLSPGNAASWPIKARLRVKLSKVSQNAEVSPKSVEKAYHSPYSQNRLQKSPLDFLRFPILQAFSHKELMGLF